MPTQTENSPLSPALAFARLLREQHAMIAQGRGDSDEAEALADRMEGPWHAMTPPERARMRGLSVDLYALADGGPKQVEMPKEELAAWRREAGEAYTRYTAGDVDAALAFFRKVSPSAIPPPLILFLQARCWEKLGDPETALAFMRAAEERDPEEHAMSVLTLLTQMDDWDGAARQAERILAKKNASPAELYFAAIALLSQTQRGNQDDPAPILVRTLAILQRARAAPVGPPGDFDFPDIPSHIASAIGFCLERLGRAREAVAVYSDALKGAPGNSELLTMRGLALYLSQLDIPAGLSDLARAAQAGAPTIWPWLILARHALAAGTYGEALRLAIQAVDRPGPPSARADAYEAIGIAQAMLGQPMTHVLENLETAARLALDNERILANLALAREKAAGRAPRGWSRNLSAPLPDARRVYASRKEELASQAGEPWGRQEVKLREGLLTA